MDSKENTKNFNPEKITVGVNALVLQDDGGGMKQHFIDTFTNIIKIQPWDKFVFKIFYFENGLKIIEEIENINEEVDKGNIFLIKLGKVEELVNYEKDFNFYLCPLNSFNPRLTSKPSIAMLADIQEHYFPQYFSKQDLLARRLIYPDIVNSCTTLVTLSEFSKQTIIERFGTDPQKIKVIYPCISSKFKKLTDKPPIKDVTMPEKYFIYPANSYFHKNHKKLLDAFKLLKERGYQEYKLVLTGNTKFGNNDVSKYIEHLSLEDLVIDLGFVDYEKVNNIFKQSTALIFPSLFEGFGIPIIEAAYLNKPILCSDIPCLREIASDAAYFFDPTSAESIVDKIIDFISGNLDHNSDKLMDLKNRFSSADNAVNLLNTIQETFKDYYFKSDKKPYKIDFFIASIPFEKTRIEKTIRSIKCFKGDKNITILKNSNIKEIINIFDKYNAQGYKLLLFAGEEVLPTVNNIVADNYYMPLVFKNNSIQYITGKEITGRVLESSKLFDRQYLHKKFKNPREIIYNKSFIKLDVGDLKSYAGNPFNKALLTNNGLAYKIYAYLTRRNYTFLLPFFKAIYIFFNIFIKLS